MKFVLVGASSAGKTSLILRCKNDVFYEYTDPTIGALYLKNTIKVDGRELNFELWDTAGQEAFRSLTPLYLRNFRVAIIVFDVTSRQSLEEAKYWIKEILKTPESKRSDTLVALCGNKIDMAGERQVEPQKELADQYNILYYETSAKTGKGVRDMFIELNLKLPETSEEDQEDQDTKKFTPTIDQKPRFRFSWC